jgi:hypothetical protein
VPAAPPPGAPPRRRPCSGACTPHRIGASSITHMPPFGNPDVPLLTVESSFKLK